jgi:ABC-type glycerol-3-phosphate transport system substrate-binding protein
MVGCTEHQNVMRTRRNELTEYFLCAIMLPYLSLASVWEHQHTQIPTLSGALHMWLIKDMSAERGLKYPYCRVNNSPGLPHAY